MAHIFISYSRKDTDFVNRIENELKIAGLKTWRDVHSIPGGAKWFRRIKQGLESSYAMLYIDTIHAEQSDWVEREFLYAASLNLPMIPVKYDPQFMSLQTINLNPVLCDNDNFAIGIGRILAQVTTLLKEPIIAGTTAPSEPEHIEVESDLTPETEPPSKIDLKKEIRHYADWLLVKSKADLRDGLYVSLEAQTEVHQQPSDNPLDFGLEMDFEMGFDRLPLELIDGETFDKSGQSVSDARIPVKDTERVVLLGEPGSGKTTTLLQLAVDLGRALQNDEKAPLPVFVPLRQFNGETSFESFVQAQMYNLQDVYNDLIENYTVIFLLDALNEMPRQSDSKRDLMPEIQLFAQAQTRWVLSCRVRDYQEELNEIPDVTKIRLQPLDPPRIRDVIFRRFKEQYQPMGIATEQDGVHLWRAIYGSSGLLTAWQAHVKQGITEAFWSNDWLLEPAEKNDFSLDWLTSPNFENQDEYQGHREWLAMRDDKRRMMYLCRNPYMTKMVTDIYAIDKSLPDNRGALFKKFVDKLLERDRKAALAIGAKWIEDTHIRNGLAQIADKMGSETEILRSEAEAILQYKLPNIDGDLLLRLAQGASLVNMGEYLRFTHQLLQEYFASEVLRAEIDAGVDPSIYWKPENWWEPNSKDETLIILAGVCGEPETVARWVASAQPELAIRVIQESGVGANLSTIDSSTRQALIDGATAKTEQSEVRGRMFAYRVLETLTADYQRKGVGLITKRGVTLPDIEWIEIPEGEFLNPENGQLEFIPTFYISCYPITYKQFQLFVESDDGYYSESFDWLSGLMDEEVDKKLTEQKFPHNTRPRENISWYQAMAFCRWLSWKLNGEIESSNIGGWSIRLPRIIEWSKAARGTDDRLYPFGNDFDTDKANTLESGLNVTSHVGLYPEGASPYGVMDMAGNVWEWTMDKAESEEDSARFRRGVIGGSFVSPCDRAQISFKYFLVERTRFSSIGFRLVRIK